MSLKVLSPGFMTLLQDYGRYGFQSIGVTTGGPMDETAFLWGNYLLNNPYNCTQLEISLGNFSGEFTENTVIALCGADLSATLNEKPLEPWSTYTVKAGDIIRFATPSSGLRCYLAIKGGFNVEPQLTSTSTVPREKLGGLQHNGERISEGDTLSYSKIEVYPPEHSLQKKVPQKFIPEYDREITLRFIPNISELSSGEENLKQFSKQTYEVTQNIDRMGYRLSGTPLPKASKGIISQGISLGTIQIPNDGQPIVLMRDRQTMGGYPIMGCVAYLDLPLLAQSTPGTKINFIPTDINTLEAELVIHKNFFRIT